MLYRTTESEFIGFNRLAYAVLKPKQVVQKVEHQVVFDVAKRQSGLKFLRRNAFAACLTPTLVLIDDRVVIQACLWSEKAVKDKRLGDRLHVLKISLSVNLVGMKQVMQRRIQPVFVDQRWRRNMKCRKQHQNATVDAFITVLFAEGIHITSSTSAAALTALIPLEAFEAPAISALDELALDYILVKQILAAQQAEGKTLHRGHWVGLF